jgi:hypothetical protein
MHSGALGVLIFLSVMTGCGPVGEQVMIQNAQGAGYSQGYGDGCASGRHAAGSVEAVAAKDTMLYLNDKQYKEGWDMGYKECEFREKRVAELSRKADQKKPVRF